MLCEQHSRVSLCTSFVLPKKIFFPNYFIKFKTASAFGDHNVKKAPCLTEVDRMVVEVTAVVDTMAAIITTDVVVERDAHLAVVCARCI